MLRYSSTRHRRLMDASEFALRDATEAASAHDSRIANTVLDDSRKYREWELRHARLLLPVAEHRRKKPQIVALRNAEVQLVHRRAFFRYLRRHEIQGERRRQLFRLFHSTLDYSEAVLSEHRNYVLAVSSRISTDHIIDVMHDSTSTRLLKQYERLFARYFDMKCYIACATDSTCTALVRSSYDDVQRELMQLRRLIETEPPDGSGGNFDREELLSRSGRFPVLNYLNA